MGVLVFGEFELDESRFELRHNGQRVRIQPKVLRLLIHLVSNRGRSVPAAELLQVLWPGQSVNPDAIKRTVLGARKALGERGDGPSSIRTIRGRGYQFVPEVRELAAADSPQVEAEPPPPAVAAPPKLDDAAADDVFVGRQSMLDALDADLAQVCAGRGRGVLLIGEPGVGKTRTLHELARRARAAGAESWFGRCMEEEGAAPFWPVIQIVREGARRRARSELQALMGAGAADIAQAIPELREWLPGLPEAPAIGSGPARFRFFESMALFVKRAAKQRPLVLLFDDLQRADLPTLRLLSFLIHQIDSARVLIVGSMRPFVQFERGAQQLLAELMREPGLRCLELSGLNRGDVARYLELRIGGAAPEPIVDALYEQTAGNPLFLQQIVESSGAALGAAQHMRWEQLAEVPSARGVRGAIERHLEILSQPSRELLRAAAVLGRDVAVGLLAQIVQRPVELVLAQLAEGVRAGLLHPVDVSGNHRFTHVLIRDALYDQLSVVERARLHARAGLSLEARGGAADDVLLPELAGHFVRAAPLHDSGRALRYTMRAAERALQRLAHEEAAAHFDRALQLIERGEAEPRQRMELLLNKGEALAQTTDVAAARAPLLQAVTLARELGASDAIARAAILLARFPESGTVDALQVGVLEEALSALPPAHRQRARLQALLAKSLCYSYDREHAGRLAMEALALARESDEPDLRAEALQNCLEALAEPRYQAERFVIRDELVRLAEQRGDHGMLLRASYAQVWNGVEVGDLRAVDSAIDTLESLAQLVREPHFRWRARVFRVMRTIVDGRIDLVEQRAQEALELGALAGEEAAWHTYAIHKDTVLAFEGRVAERELLIREVCARFPGLAGWRAVLAGIDADLGRKDRARAVLEELVADDMEMLRRETFLLSALAPASELCARVGDARSARLMYEAILPYESHHGIVSFGVATHGPITRHLGLLARRFGDQALAARHFEHAIEASERMPSPTFLSLSCIAYARSLLKSDEARARQQAAELLMRAWEVAEGVQLKGLVTLCRALMRNEQLPPPRLARAGRS